MTFYLIDISNYQAGLDISQVAAEGFGAVVCKATEGTGWNDPTFDGFIGAIRNAGLIPGAYHFLRAGDGAEQAREFHARVAAHGGPKGWIIQLDVESDGGAGEMAAWAAEWNRLTASHPFLIYSGSWWWGPRVGGFSGASLTPYLWHSSYVRGAGTAVSLYGSVSDAMWTPGYGGWSRATILQFSSTASVAGYQLDVNAFEGSPAELARLVGKESEVADWETVTAILAGVWPAGYVATTAPTNTASGNQPRETAQYNLKDVQTRILNKLDELGVKISAGALSDDQVTTVATRISDALVAAPHVPLGDADVPAIEAAITQVLKKVFGSA